LKTKRLKEKKEKKKARGIGSVAKAVKFFEKNTTYVFYKKSETNNCEVEIFFKT
jgi:hypothetical protein